MNKIAVITDNHFGGKNDNHVIRNIQQKFYEETFWPSIDKHNIKTIICLGDLIDRRKYIQFETLKFTKEQFFTPAHQRNIDFHWITGNHDSAYVHTLELNASAAFQEYDNLKVYTKPTELLFNNTKVLFLPWICDDNFIESFKTLEEFNGSTVMGHLEFAGFEMHRGMPSTHGYLTNPFKHVPLVLSGHFHHRSTNKNINYLGCPYEMTWSDYDDPKGFHWWYPDENKIEFVPNPHKLFYSFVYDDQGKDSSYVKVLMDHIKLNDLSQKIIKIVTKSKTHPIWHEAFSDAVLQLGAFDVMFIDDSAWSTEIDDHDVVEGEKSLDSLAMIKWYVKHQPWANLEIKQSVEDLMVDLYTEATDFSKARS